jgi:hypothetical protein
LVLRAGEDHRRYNLPTVNHQLAAVIPDIPAEYSESRSRDICLYLRQAPDFYDAETAGASASTETTRILTTIHPEHALYLPLHYVLFYPYGGRRYYKSLQLIGTTSHGTARKRTAMTARMFYRFHLHTRSGVFETLHRSALLFQQFIVYGWASTERSDLDFIRFNQGKIRAELNGGDFDGQYRLIYRCRLSTSENLGFTLTRMQFPIRLAFTMTINKSQGQSLR